MTKFKDMTGKQKRNLFIVIGVVVAIVLSLLIALIVYVVPVKGEVSLEHWYSRMKYTDDYAFNLYKTPGEDFKILAIADPQLADLVEVGPKGDPYKEIEMLVENDRPDLIIVMGDITWTAFTKNSVKSFVKFMDKLDIPWAPILGNHEDEKEQGYYCNVDRNWVADRFLESVENGNCLFKKGPNNIGGVGNYVINIKEKSADGNSEKVVETLVMMDSHAKRQYPEYDNGWYYDYIYDAQMLWYKWVIDGVTNEINDGVMPESMLYLHIPLPEYEIAYEEYLAAKTAYEKAGTDAEKATCKAVMDSYAYTGKWVEGVWGSNTAGDDKFKDENEKLGNTVNSGFFDVLKEVGSTKYVYAGHDHRNNYSILYQDIRLTYTTKTGYKCSYEPGRTGGTYITIGDDNKVSMKHVYGVYNDKGRLQSLVDGESF